MEFVRKEDMETVGNVKRLLEWCSLDPGFGAKFYDDPEGMLKEIGVPYTPDEVSFKPNTDKCDMSMEAAFPGTPAEKYANFVNSKIQHREYLKQSCAPDNKAMRKWRERQTGRCNIQLGARVAAIIQAVFTIELADGCSVGCEFCGLNAGRLKSVFRYTDENAALYNGVITYMKEILGDAAGYGTLYFATEPLDNPDYELFNKDYVKVFGRIPQITTAAAMRHTDRLHKLLKELNEDRGTIYRFSVLSLDTFKQIVEEFTPEELTLVELLPQFSEAPGNHFAKVGRNANDDEEYDDTISCISGFVVNMARKEVKLTTPTTASKDNPTGEIVLYKGNFEDIESFKNLINYCIKTYMSNILGPEEEFKLREGVRFESKEGMDSIICDKGIRYDIPTGNKDDKFDAYELLFEIISDEYMTRREIVTKFNEKLGAMSRPDITFFIINNLWKMGVLETKSGSI